MKPEEYPPLKIPSIEETRSEDSFQPYVNTLKKIFGEILGWTEAHTEAHVERQLQETHFRSWFGHTTPCDDAASVIVPAALRRRLIARRISTVGIHNEITLALEGMRDTYNMHPDTDPDYDWQRARDEIADIIKEHETSSKNAA
jgi:hypothetical protein